MEVLEELPLERNFPLKPLSRTWFRVTIIQKMVSLLQNNKNRHFSHVNKRRIFKNFNLTRKIKTQILRQFAEKPFQAPKIIFEFPKLISQKLSYGHLFKEEKLKFRFLRGRTFQVLLRGSLSPKKT